MSQDSVWPADLDLHCWPSKIGSLVHLTQLPSFARLTVEPSQTKQALPEWLPSPLEDSGQDAQSSSEPESHPCIGSLPEDLFKIIIIKMYYVYGYFV